MVMTVFSASTTTAPTATTTAALTTISAADSLSRGGKTSTAEKMVFLVPLKLI